MNHVCGCSAIGALHRPSEVLRSFFAPRTIDGKLCAQAAWEDAAQAA